MEGESPRNMGEMMILSVSLLLGIVLGILLQSEATQSEATQSGTKQSETKQSEAKVASSFSAFRPGAGQGLETLNPKLICKEFACY